MLVRPSDRLVNAREVQPQKAQLPMLVRLAGRQGDRDERRAVHEGVLWELRLAFWHRRVPLCVDGKERTLLLPLLLLLPFRLPRHPSQRRRRCLRHLGIVAPKLSLQERIDALEDAALRLWLRLIRLHPCQEWRIDGRGHEHDGQL